MSIVGPLKKLKSRRRSRSVSGLMSATPGPRTMMSAAKGRTPLAQSQQLHQPVPHSSRSKYRTPMSGAIRQKAASADRITPKVNPANPFSMLRHARAGEAVFSVTGSPIVASK